MLLDWGEISMKLYYKAKEKFKNWRI